MGGGDAQQPLADLLGGRDGPPLPCVDVQTPATEKGAYKLSARMFCDGGCRDGECL